MPRWSLIDKALGLGQPEPQETYSSSPRLCADLGIPKGTKGRLPKEKRVLEGLEAWTVRPDGPDELAVTGPEPFRPAAARAMGVDELRAVDTGLESVAAEREQWDDGNNTLALSPRVAVAYERNVETNSRLEEAGIEVVAIAGSELGSGRGGPRCMSCPIARDPA